VQGDTTAVDSAKACPLLTRGFDAAGNEYIYLTGVGSTVAGSVVTYDEAGLSTLVVANAIGPVAIAQAAVDSTSEFGWYLIHGTCSVSCDAGIVDNSKVYIDGTAGRVDDTVVAGDQVLGAVFRSVDAANFATIQVSYPSVSDSLG
jgi:hypothetical protein